MIYMNLASVSYSIINGYKWVRAFSLEAEYTFPHAEKIKDFLADLSVLVVAVPAAIAASAKAEAKEESEKSVDNMDFDL
jgi:large subunit ribosomal protein LP0